MKNSPYLDKPLYGMAERAAKLEEQGLFAQADKLRRLIAEPDSVGDCVMDALLIGPPPLVWRGGLVSTEDQLPHKVWWVGAVGGSQVVLGLLPGDAHGTWEVVFKPAANVELTDAEFDDVCVQYACMMAEFAKAGPA